MVWISSKSLNSILKILYTNILNATQPHPMKFKIYTRCYFKKASLPVRCKGETYTYHTWMSLLVPVIEMMFGVTRHSLSFDIWRQTQFCKTKKVKKLKVSFAQHRQLFNWPQSYPAVCCSSPLCQQDLQNRPLQDVRKCRDRSCLDEDSTAGSTPPAVMVPATVLVVMSERSQIMWPQIINCIINVVVVLLKGAVTTSIHSSWPFVRQEVGLCHGQPEVENTWTNRRMCVWCTDKKK